MAQDKIQAPSSSTGLMRFYDVSVSNVQLDPRAILAFAAAVIILEVVAQML